MHVVKTATAGQEIVPLEVNVLSPSAILAGITPAVATLSVFTALMCAKSSEC